jgi:peptide-methionine (R)-S-oxide reductase
VTRFGAPERIFFIKGRNTMNRRHLMRTATLSTLLLGLGSLRLRAEETFEITRTPEEWKAILSPEQFAVLREEDTERPFTSALLDEKRKGTYNCAACDLPLYASETKYESGTGWPSFFQPLEPGAIGTRRDFRLFMPRTEYHCSRCGGHQGHVFGDGPAPTGQRYCNNGLALVFVPEGEPLPPLVRS